MDQVTSTGEKEGWQRHGWTRPSRPHLPEEAASSQSPKPRHAKDGRPYSHRAGCAAASDADLSQKKTQEKKSLRCGWARAADRSTEIKKHHWMRMQLQVGEAIDDTLRPWMDMEVTPGCSASQPNN